MKKENEKPVVVRLHDDPEKAVNLHAYVVDSKGKIVESSPFRGKEAILKTSPDEIMGGSKVYIAQEIPKKFAAKANERMLMKAGAYESVKNLSNNFIDISKLPSGVMVPLFWDNCLITGHVNKNFIIDGNNQNLPVCNARVHICEVETELIWPYIPIYKRIIPDWVIVEIGDKFKNLNPVVVNPQPIPDPIGPKNGMKRKVELSSLGKSNNLSGNFKLSPTLPLPPPLPHHVMSAMTSGSVATIRKAMIDYHEVLYPYFCLWEVYWPWIYTYDEETIVYTDCNGHFEMWENTLTEDGPLNIYIWVEVCINGVWQTVYKPSVPCHTRWNYACNTEINIQVTDSRVAPCDCSVDGPADAVWFRSIGWSASALHIEQNVLSSIPIQSATLKNGGCTDIINGQKVSPFGGGLALKLFCGANIFAAGVTHYRWKKTMVADANQNPVFGSTSIISGNVARPYLVKLSATHYETHYAQLGAEGSSSDFAYRIPHHDVTSENVAYLQDPDDLNASRMAEWTDMFFDSAYLDTNSLTDGIYQFELELLKKQSGGSFTVVPVAKATFQISEYNVIGNSQDAPDNYLNINSGNAAKADSYKMNVRIDNAPCVADIHDAMLNETGDLSGPCGFIHYGNTGQHIHISFEASHPRNFATFNFGIVKGNNTVATGINTSERYVLSSVPVGGISGDFTLSGGLFGHDFTVLELLNGCVGQAAFSENLWVWSLATDGTYRLTGAIENGGMDNPLSEAKYYNPSDVNAFALSNT